MKASILAKATAVGEAPTEAGVSEVLYGQGYMTFLWETPRGHLCLAQAPDSGASDVRMCGDPTGALPKPGSVVTPVFGPGTAPEGWMVVLFVEHSHRVASVRFRDAEVDWKLVRTLAPGSTGRDVYYVPLPDAPTGDLDVTFEVAGQQATERLHLE
ncbi:hypothetical protein J7F03_37720 [Streptomyces sp. ISL-43]|uniref:hypothetical protein n=1 Tax=Streptomyces sp. ISL-43 TaxID=2819183 RepID=UPI001BE71210|nr:hypothetical protein [Streptomyces sp. ISL-43]MBT2452683.1 hypothetical protein [Streptomyces sp. ISL-43]